MKIWILQIADPEERGWPYFDIATGFVIVADTEPSARTIAADRHGDEGRDKWLRPSETTCEEIDPNGPAREILRAYRGS